MPQADLTLERFRAALDAFPDLEHIELQGEGESLMHPRFFEMVDMLRARNIRVSLISNGSHFTDAAVTQILDAQLEKISISLESADPKSFREIRGGKLEKVERGIRALLAERNRRGLMRPAVGFSVTVLNRTRHELGPILALYKALGLDGGITMQPLERKADYTDSYPEEITAEMLDDAAVDEVWLRFRADKQVRTIDRNRAPVAGFFDDLMKGWMPGQRRCPWLDSGLFINNAGQVTPCCMIKNPNHALGQLGETPAETILQNRTLLRAQLQSGQIPDPCQGCELARFATLSKFQMLGWGLKALKHRFLT